MRVKVRTKCQESKTELSAHPMWESWGLQQESRPLNLAALHCNYCDFIAGFCRQPLTLSLALCSCEPLGQPMFLDGGADGPLVRTVLRYAGPSCKMQGERPCPSGC